MGARKVSSSKQRWNAHWQPLDPLYVQELLEWLERLTNSSSEDAIRRIGEMLSGIPACLEFPMGELTTPGLSPWLLIWRSKQRLSDLYPQTESKGRYDCQGLEFLVRVEGESLLSVLLAAKHIRQWRFAISLHISSEQLQAHMHEVLKEKNIIS